MDNDIIKPENLPLDEKVYLKKGFKGWTVVHPIRNEDGTLNLKNLLIGGSWWNLIIVLVIVAVMLGVLYEYSSTINNLLECFRDPVKLEQCRQLYGQPIPELGW